MQSGCFKKHCLLLQVTVLCIFSSSCLVTWLYLLMRTGYDIKEYQYQGTRPQRTDVTLSRSIVLRLSAFWCTCLSYSFITFVLSLHTLHASSIKPHDAISILLYLLEPVQATALCYWHLFCFSYKYINVTNVQYSDTVEWSYQASLYVEGHVLFRPVCLGKYT
jgi:hypothetical protein